MVHEPEVIFVIQHVQVFDDFPVGQVASRVAYGLVKDGEGVAHAAIGFLCDDVQGFRLIRVAFLFGHELQVVDNGLYAHPVEIIHLATAQDGG